MKNKFVSVILCFLTICIMSCGDFSDAGILQPFSQFWQAEPIYDDSGSTRSLNVAAVSLEVDLSPELNRQKMVFYLDKIKSEQPNIRLILFPEAILGFYYKPSNPFEYQSLIAETIPGETTNVISQKAIEHQIFVSFGMVEKSDGFLYNSQVLIAPDGNILSVYRKIFITSDDKENGITAGNDVFVNIIDNIKVATIICHDINSLEINRKIHASGAELILLPMAWSDTVSPYTVFLPYQFTYTWILWANRFGNEDGINYNGLLSLTAPSGERRIRTTGKEGYIYGVVKCR